MDETKKSSITPEATIAALEQQLAAGAAEIKQVPNPHIVYPGKPADIAYDLELYRQLETVEGLLPAFQNQLQLEPAALDRIPLLGSLFRKLRRGLHEIALFYTNRALQHQLQVNHHLLRSVARLTVVVQQQQRELERRTAEEQHE